MSAHESGSRSGGERGRGSRRRGERNQVPTGPGWEELFTPTRADRHREARRRSACASGRRGVGVRRRRGDAFNDAGRGGAAARAALGASEETLQAQAATAPIGTDVDELPDLSVYYRVSAPSERLPELAAQFAAMDEIEGAYVQPIGAPPSVATAAEEQTIALALEDVEQPPLNEMAPAGEVPPIVTPDFTAKQGYLTPAPVGIDAQYAWTLPGGRGSGVRIIDCEWGWRFTHEDLIQSQGGVLAGSNSTNDNHGTAVLGEISGDRNPFGITGIAEQAWVGAVSFTTLATPTAIKEAADRLGPGDIILLEIHRVGPRGKWLPIEWWPADFDAIRYAIGKGIVVVEAGGNGGENLDDPFYNAPQAGFPASWRNPLNPANPSSGAVMVGAGNPPPGRSG